MEYLIRFVQMHETFRKPEIEALAELAQINVEFLSYLTDSPFCIVRLPCEADARRLISRSILADAIYELWGTADNYEDLHADVRRRSHQLWDLYKHDSFRFKVHGFQGKRSSSEHRDIIESFSYLDFQGPIRMKNAEHEFDVFEEYELISERPREFSKNPKRLFLGRFLGTGGRSAIVRYDLKKRKYINTTSMDSELALITANLAQASAGKLFYDPFVGTASFPIACSHFGAVSMGSDIDGRVVRGKPNNNICTSFQQYGLRSLWLDGFASDLTNTPLRTARWLDGIVCDPPYGIREGVKVLGRRDGLPSEELIIDGVPAHYRPGFIAPKKAYSFDAMIDDLLYFAAATLVDGGRLSMWIPTANDEDIEIAIPQNPYFSLVSVCIQSFNKWSRRLITYSRLPDSLVGEVFPRTKKEIHGSADELNKFRKKYFEGFKAPNSTSNFSDT
ncbi:uncharacterized protein PV09_02320 [Verruconis gallopava]|uniref:tRNA (guanine(10)-N(2))-methyltransferase n=1 Tax=Verruconis gallopava TaxID=253628 RepID=A0A0D2AJ82_9PEZI|nr:uncharacterized protein PV09_02320 [Verruconis gallopava]KIW06605.1 hypothetical protein PV09_02320 [Verruconis gallopava]